MFTFTDGCAARTFQTLRAALSALVAVGEGAVFHGQQVVAALELDSSAVEISPQWLAQALGA